MEYWYLSLAILLIGTVFVFLTKQNYKSRILTLFLSMGAATLLTPVIKTITEGSATLCNFNFLLFSQRLSGIIDPLSGFFMAVLAVITFLYLYSLLIKFGNNHKKWFPEIIIFLLFSALLLLGMQNGIYFYLAYITINLIFYLLIEFSGNLKILKQNNLYLYFINSIIAISIMLLGMFSHSLDFSEMVKSLVSNANYSNAIFNLIFLGFGLPVIISNKIMNKYTRSEKEISNELITFEIIFYIIYFYCLIRFIGMGAFPLISSLRIALTILFGITFFDIFKLLKTNLLSDEFIGIKNIQINFSLISLLTGVSGYIYKLPIISILGFCASLLFFVNTIIASYTLKEDNKVLKPISITGVLNCNCCPATLGFYSWGMLLFTCYLGIISNIPDLKILSIITALLTLPIIGAQFYKSILIIKNIYYSEKIIKSKLPDVSLFYAGLALFFGLFPEVLYKIIIVPVSFIVGGTKYIDLFNALKLSVKNIELYILFSVVLLLLYIFGKMIICKIIYKKTPPNE